MFDSEATQSIKDRVGSTIVSSVCYCTQQRLCLQDCENTNESTYTHVAAVHLLSAYYAV
jgi:hypothetical protein